MSTAPPSLYPKNDPWSPFAGELEYPVPPPILHHDQHRRKGPPVMSIDTHAAKCFYPPSPPSLSSVPSLNSPSLHSSSPLSSPISSPMVPHRTVPAYGYFASPLASPLPSPMPRLHKDVKPSPEHLNGYPLHPVFAARYCIVDELGSGGFGFVLSARRSSDGQEVAVKFIYRNKIPRHGWAVHPVYGSVPIEVYILSQTSHPNIVHMIEHFQDENFFYLVTELHGTPWHAREQAPLPIEEVKMMGAPGMVRRSSHDLFECIETHSSFSEARARYIMRQVVDAMHHLSRHGIAHRDIKDENILINDDFEIQLCDFGSATITTEEVKFDTFFGITINFAAPECFHRRPYCARSADVWSLGILMYTCLCGSTPFANPEAICNKSWRLPSKRAARISPECQDLLNIMLQKKPDHRATMNDVVSHSWWHCLL